MDQKRSITIYGKMGEFLNKVYKYGRGPQEYEMTLGVDIDISNGNIIVMGMHRILEYNSKGDFIRTVIFADNPRLVDQYLEQIKKIGELYFVLTHINKKTKYSGVLIDSSSKILTSISYPEDDYDRYLSTGPLHPIMQPIFFKHKENVRLINGYNDYILSIGGKNSIDTVFKLNYGRYKADKNYGSQMMFKSPYIWPKFKIFESDQYLFMIFHVGPLADKPAKMIGMRGNQYNYQHDCSFFNKKTGDFQFIHQPEINQLGFVEDFEGGPAVWPKYVSSDGYLITYMYAHEFKAHAETHEVSDKFKSIADNLKDTDNPVIVRVKLKN